MDLSNLNNLRGAIAGLPLESIIGILVLGGGAIIAVCILIYVGIRSAIDGRNARKEKALRRAARQAKKARAEHRQE